MAWTGLGMMPTFPLSSLKLSGRTMALCGLRNDAAVSIALPKIPNGEFSSVRLQGRNIGRGLPNTWFAIALRALCRHVVHLKRPCRTRVHTNTLNTTRVGHRPPHASGVLWKLKCGWQGLENAPLCGLTTENPSPAVIAKLGFQKRWAKKWAK